MMPFKYSDGSLVKVGDVILVINKPGRIEQILEKGTSEAEAYHCYDSGGLLIRFDDGDLQLWPETDEDLVFVKEGASEA
jgi:hypothetical protein